MGWQEKPERTVRDYQRYTLPDGKMLMPGVVGYFGDSVEHPEIAEAKFRAMAEGAWIASKRLWDHA